MSLKSLLLRKIWNQHITQQLKKFDRWVSDILVMSSLSFSPLPQSQNAVRRAVRSGLCQRVCQSSDMQAPWPAAGLSEESPSRIHLNVLLLQHALRFSTPLFLKPQLLVSRKHAKSWGILCLCAQERGREGERRGKERVSTRIGNHAKKKRQTYY